MTDKTETLIEEAAKALHADVCVTTSTCPASTPTRTFPTRTFCQDCGAVVWVGMICRPCRDLAVVMDADAVPADWPRA